MLVSSDATVREHRRAGRQEARSQEFVRELPAVEHTERRRSELLDRLDDETLARLERLRRGAR